MRVVKNIRHKDDGMNSLYTLGHFEKPDRPTIQKEGRSGMKPYEFNLECLQSTKHDINKERIFDII